MIDSFGRSGRLRLEPGHKPGARRARRRIGPIDRMQSKRSALHLGHVELDEPPPSTLVRHRFGHKAQADAFLQKHMYRAKIGASTTVR